MTGYTTFEWAMLTIWLIVFTILIYGIIAIHDIPAGIARKRNHPHADAIEAAGWVSLFMLHAIWPFLWIWSMYYKPSDAKESGSSDQNISELKNSIASLNKRIEELEKKES